MVLENKLEIFFQIRCINLSRCLKWNEMQGNWTLQNTLNIPIFQLLRSQNTDLESLLKHYSTPEVSKGKMVCKNCKRKPKNHCVKFVKSSLHILCRFTKMSIRFSLEKSYLVKTKVNLSNTMNFSFLSLKDIYSTNRIYHLCSAISRKAGESIEYGHFVAYIFDGEECRVYDDNKINYVQTKSVLEDEEFQRSIYAVSYIRKIDNIETLFLPNSQWSLTQEEEEEVKGIFISQTDEDFGIARSSNIRSLDEKHWLSSEVLLHCLLLK